jgi:hypothetical protein
LNEDLITWTKDRFITLDDFHGEPDENSSHYAMSGIRFDQENKISVNSEKPEFQFLEIKGSAVFEKYTSWRKKYTPSNLEKIIKHEQGHFDIAEEYARKYQEILEQELIGKKFSFKVKDGNNYDKSAKNEANEIIKKTYAKLETEYKNEQKKYEDETKHGIDLNRQEQYNKRFEKLRVG